MLVRALLGRPPALLPSIIRAGPLQLHLDANRVYADGKEIAVTANEWRLLRLLAGRPGMTFSRDAIMTEVGMSPDTSEVAVDHRVSRLRVKLKHCGGDQHLRTLRSLGFTWVDSE